MNRRTVFGGIAALALVLSLVTGAGVAIAAIAGNALTAASSAPAGDDGTAGSSASNTIAPVPNPSATASAPSAPSVFQGPQPLTAGTPTVTDAEIMADAMSFPWAADDPAAAKAWGEEEIIVTRCMAGKGWDYDPRTLAEAPFSRVTPGDPPKLLWDPAAWLALNGDTGGGDAYRWQDAGCYGYAVHVTGNDGNN